MKSVDIEQNLESLWHHIIERRLTSFSQSHFCNLTGLMSGMIHIKV